MHQALYRSERPEQFEEIIGQKHIVKILQNQIKTDSVSQAYLFTGTRGTGKTTTARILAKAVNCLGHEDGTPESGRIPCGVCENCQAIKEGRFMDVIELDAASNNGVDDLRSIIDSVQYPPTVGKYKVYIIDEVHMLTTAAENAFLKTLEEPPEYAMFILATTDPEKVRATIKSRCMTLNFKRVSENDLVEGMRRICDKKGVNITDEALSVISVKADGSVRDALSILEQCISTGDELVDKELVLDYIGSAGDDFYLSITGAIQQGDLQTALAGIDQMIRAGRDAKQLIADWLVHYRNLMIVKYVADPSKIIRASEENIARLRQQAEALGADEIGRGVRKLSEVVNLSRYSTQPRILLETTAVQLMDKDFGEDVGLVRRPSAGHGAAGAGAGRGARPQRPAMPARNSAPQPVARPAAPALQARPSASAQPAAPAAAPQPMAQPSPAPQAATRPGTPAKPAQRPAEPTYTEAPAYEEPPFMMDAPQAVSMEEAAAFDQQSMFAAPELVSEPAPLFTPEETGANQTQQAMAQEMDGAEDHHVGELEVSDELDDMFDRIVDEIAARDTMFRMMVANHMRLVDYNNGQMTVMVKKNKRRFAEDSLDEMNRVAKALYGERTFINLKEGTVIPAPPREERAVQPASTEQEIERVQDNDEMIDELAEDVSSLLGIDVNIIDN